nr:unnamed protein product [Callosobruchus analis]
MGVVNTTKLEVTYVLFFFINYTHYVCTTHSGWWKNIINKNNRWFKIRDRRDDIPAQSPESKKIHDFYIASQELKFDFRFIPGGAQMGLSGQLENIISNNNRSKSVTKGMTPQLLVPNPKNTRLLYCKSRVKIRFPLYSGWCTDGTFRAVREHHKQQ